MALARNLLSRRLHSLLEPQNVACVYHIIHSNTPPPHKIPPFHHRPFSSSPQTHTESEPTHGMKSLHFLFQDHPEREGNSENGTIKGKTKQGEAVGLSEKTGQKENEVGRVEDVEKKRPKRKLKQGEAVGLSEKTGQKESEVGRVKDHKKKKPERKLKQGEAVALSEKAGKKESEVEGEKDLEKKKPERKLKQSEDVGLSEKAGHKESEEGCGKDHEKKKSKKKLKKPEKWKVKFIDEAEEEEEEAEKGEQQKEAEPKRLYDLFSQGKESKKANPKRLTPGIAPVEMHKEVRQKEPDRREPVVFRRLSLDMEVFLSYLYKEGYFKDANFVKGKEFDLRWFDAEFARHYTLSAVQKFGKDKQEISKWLSGSDLKQVAMFGCPSVYRAKVFPSKRLRTYFKIPENTVCSKCMLRDSCKFVNQDVWGTENNNLDLAMVMKVICSYSMSIVDPQLVVPDKINNSVNRLLKEVLKLSRTI